MTHSALKPKEEITRWERVWPGSYGDVAAEYDRLRRESAFTPLVHMEWLKVSGPDAIGFLQGLLSRDVARLRPGTAGPSWALDAKGKIITHLWVFCRSSNEVWLQTIPGMVENLKQHLSKYLIMEDANLEVMDMATVTVQGPRTELEFLPQYKEALAVPHDRCGFGGYDLICKREHLDRLLDVLLADSMVPVGLRALDRLRVSSFMPLFGVDMDQGSNPLIYGHGEAISRKKGCFIGQETVAKTRDRGRPPKLLVQLKGKPQEMPKPGHRLRIEDKDVAAITSASLGEIGQTLALATLPYKDATGFKPLQDENNVSWFIRKISDFKV